MLHAVDQTQALRRGIAPDRNDSGFVIAGREPLLAVLNDAWQAARAGSPQVVLVGGDSGTGKTSLVKHACQGIATAEHEVMVAWGEASSWSVTLEPYTSIRRAMDHLMGASRLDTATPGRYLSRPTLRPDHIERVMQAWPALNDVLVSASTMREMIPLARKERHDALLESLDSQSLTNADHRSSELTSLLIELTQSWPIVLVLEDLQWSGPLTNQLLLYLTRALANAPNTRLLVIGTYRQHDLHPAEDGSPHPFQHLLEGILAQPHVSTVDLNTALQPEAGMAFVRALAQANGVTRPEATDWVLRQTAGHPLFAQELIDRVMLLPEGADLPENVPFEATTATGSLLRQRLRHVTSLGQRVLEVAAVMGAHVLPQTISAILQLSLENLMPVIQDELIGQHRLLELSEPVPADPPLSAFAFSHRLFRDYLYEQIVPDRRRILHAQIATHLNGVVDKMNAESVSVMLEHLVNAEDWHGAATITHHIAQLRIERKDWDLARADLEAAEAFAHRMADPYMLWRIRTSYLPMFRALREYDAAKKLAEQILDQTQWNNWPLVEASTNHHLGEVYYDLSQLELAEQHLLEAVEGYETSGDSNPAAGAEAMLCHTTYRLGRYDVARTHAQNALKRIRDIQNSWVRPEAMVGLGNCEIELGYYERAMSLYKHSEEIATMMGKLSMHVIPILNYGLCQVQLKHPDEALETLKTMYEREKHRMSARLIGYTKLYMGYAHEQMENFPAARTAYQDSLDARMQSPRDPQTADSFAGLLRVALASGNDAEVKRVLEELESLIAEYGPSLVEDMPLVMVSLARARLHIGDDGGYAEAIESAHKLMMERADLLSEKEARESYLTAVTINAELGRRYAELQAS